MKNTWFRGARDSKAREQRRSEVLAAEPALKVLSMYVQDQIRDTQRTRDSEEFHSEFQYAQNQARAAGKIDALRNMLSIIQIKEDQNV